MISKHYEKVEMNIVEFSLDDILTNSSVVPTYPEDETHPEPTSQGGVQTGGNGSADIVFNFDDLP